MKLKIQKSLLSLVGLASALLLMGASSGGEPQATSVPEVFTSQLVWTPNGKHIFFSRGYQGIFRVDVAGSELQAIPEDVPMGTASSPGYALPALSPDGTRLAYVARLRGQTHSAAIIVSALDGTGARRLTHGDKFNTHPAWSPDGEEIAYIADGKLSVMRADGSNARVLAPSLEAINAAPVWSPDGSRIAFVGVQQDSEPRYAVYTVRSHGTDLTKLGATVSVPSWSPDGSRIAFLMPEEGVEVGLFTLGSDGTDPLKVWSLGESDIWVDNLSWSPDGDAILFSSADGKVVVVNLEDVEERVLARAAGRWAAWSADGARFAVVASRNSDEEAGDSRREVLYTKMRDGRFRRVVVEGNDERLAARYPGWYDALRNVAACGQGYVVSDPTVGGFVVPNPFENPGLVEDCEILLAIRDQLAGDFLLNWSAKTPITEWWGLMVFLPPHSRSTNRVEGLWFPFADYTQNSTPYSLFLEMYLIRLFAYQAPVSSFATLQDRDSRHGGLNGSIPPELTDLPDLRYINLSGNSLTGSIPSEIGSLDWLFYLGLRDNNLTGSIPPRLGNSPVAFVDLGGNQLSGEIPPELGKSMRGIEIAIAGGVHKIGLLQLILANNDLSGSIPWELRNLDSLIFLDLSNNDLSGGIPPWLGDFSGLRELNLGNNELTGSIPPGLGDLYDLQRLDLSNNSLTGEIPPGLGPGILRRLKVLNLAHNDLSGSIPPELSNLLILELMDLSHNSLVGNIPPELGSGKLRSLKVLNLAHNDLSGSIPPELSNLLKLELMDLSHNSLVGNIPPELGSGKLRRLKVLNLAHNDLSGSIPPELGSVGSDRLYALEVLNLAHNELNGNVSPELANLLSLKELYLQGNEFVGCVPAAFSSQLTELKSDGLEFCAE